MSNDKKILIVLWVAVLLSIVLECDAQRGISYQSGRITNNYNQNTVVNNDITMPGDTMPDLTTGYLETLFPGYTYNQIKTLRLANWEAFQATCNYAKANGFRVVLPSTAIEFHMQPNEFVDLSDYETLVIKGGGKHITKLFFYPNVKLYSIKVFDTYSKGSNIIIEDLSVWTDREKIETYNVLLRPGGNTNQIQITDAQVSAYLTSNFVGKTVYAVTSSTTTPAPVYTVTNYTAGTKTLTVNTTVTATGSDDVGLLGIKYIEDTDIDTITQYGEYWYTDTIVWRFIYGIEQLQPDGVSQLYEFNNVDFRGFDVFVFASGDNVTITSNNSYFSGHEGSFYMYSNFTTNTKLILNNVVFENNSYYGVAYVDGNLDATNRFGSAVYSHPNTQWIWNNVDVINNNAAAVRQYSATGNKPTPSYASSRLTNCSFVNNYEYSIQTSQDMPVFITNCYFEDACYFNSDVIITNSKFNDATIGTYSEGTKLKLINSQLVGTWFTLTGTSIDIDNCEIETIQNQTVAINAMNTATIRIKNSRFTNNTDTPIVGNSIFGFIFPRKLLCENVSFEDTDTPLFWRYSSEDFSVNYSKSAYLPIKFTKCSFAYQTITGSSQFVHYNNAIFDECTFGASNENKGRWVFKPRDDFYPATLSGSTISISTNYNRYFVSGSITKINSPAVGLSGPYYFTAAGTTIFTAYNSSTNIGSNINFSDTLQVGETIEMIWNPLDIKSASTTLVSNENIGSTASGSLIKHVWNEINFGSSTLVPGSITITAGGITFTDDGRGNLTATGGSGWIGYDTNMLTLYFDANPGVTNILITYNYYNTIHQAGMWSKID